MNKNAVLSLVNILAFFYQFINIDDLHTATSSRPLVRLNYDYILHLLFLIQNLYKESSKVMLTPLKNVWKGKTSALIV